MRYAVAKNTLMTSPELQNQFKQTCPKHPWMKRIQVGLFGKSQVDIIAKYIHWRNLNILILITSGQFQANLEQSILGSRGFMFVRMKH